MVADPGPTEASEGIVIWNIIVLIVIGIVVGLVAWAVIDREPDPTTDVPGAGPCDSRAP